MNKKVISLFIASALLISSLSTTVLAKSFDGKQNVSLTHAFTVNFNKTLAANQDFSKVTIKDGSGNVVPVTVSIGSDDESITVTPKMNYSPSTNYTLTVDGIKDTAGDNLSDNATMQFTTVSSNGGGTTVDPTQERLPFSLTDAQKSELNTALEQYKLGQIKAEDVIKIVDPDTTDYSTLQYSPQPYADQVATNDQLDTWELDGYDSLLGKTDLSKTAGYFKDNVGEASRYESLCWKTGVFQICDKVDSNNNLVYEDSCTDGLTSQPNSKDNFKVTSSSNPLLYNQLKDLYSYFYLNKLNDSVNYKNVVMDIPNRVIGSKSGIPAVNFRIDHYPTDEEFRNEGMLETSDVDTLVYLDSRKDMMTKYLAKAENEAGITVNPNVDMRINSVSQNEFIDGTTYGSVIDISNPSQDVLNSIYGQLEALVGKEPAMVIYNKYIAYMLIQNYATNGAISEPINFNYGSIKAQIFGQNIRLWY